MRVQKHAATVESEAQDLYSTVRVLGRCGSFSTDWRDSDGDLLKELSDDLHRVTRTSLSVAADISVRTCLPNGLVCIHRDKIATIHRAVRRLPEGKKLFDNEVDCS